MHRAKAANKALIAGSLVIFFGCFALIRIHTTIGDTAFLRSMIPHHDGARAQAAWPSKLCATPGAGG